MGSATGGTGFLENIMSSVIKSFVLALPGSEHGEYNEYKNTNSKWNRKGVSCFEWKIRRVRYSENERGLIAYERSDSRFIPCHTTRASVVQAFSEQS